MTKCSAVTYWYCQKVLPLVYDDSLSYYEQMCQLVDYINGILTDDNTLADEVAQLQQAVAEIEEWIKNMDTTYIHSIVNDYLKSSFAQMITVGINDDGYIVYNVPDSWATIMFNTTGLDIELAIEPEYGHLVISF